MAGYPFSSSAEDNHHQNNQNHLKLSKHQTTPRSTPLLANKRLYRPVSSINRISSPRLKETVNRIFKSKTSLRMNMNLYQDQEKFRRMLQNHIRNYDSKSTECIRMMSSRLQSPEPINVRQSCSLVNLVKTKDFRTVSSYLNDNSDEANGEILQYRRESSVEQIREWKLPKKSNDFKASVERKFGLLLQSDDRIQKEKIEKPIQNDTRFCEKMNNVELFKREKHSITSKIRSMFQPLASFDFYSKFQRYIPYLKNDYEISEDAKTIPAFDEPIPKLSSENERELEEILSQKNRLLVSAYSINIHTSDIKTLDGTTWLNDAVIEFYLNLIVTRSQKSPDKYPSVYTFNTYFYPRLAAGSVIGRWANKVDFFSFDILLVPIHHASHWRLAVIDIQRKRIEYYDSLGSEFRECVNKLAEFISQDCLKKKNKELDLSEWKLCYTMAGIPKQANFHDCGVFTCKYADFVARRADLTFTQKHIPMFRRSMMYEIINQRMLS